MSPSWPLHPRVLGDAPRASLFAAYYFRANAMRGSADMSYEERRSRAAKIVAAVGLVELLVFTGVGVAAYRSTGSWGWVIGIVAAAAFVTAAVGALALVAAGAGGLLFRRASNRRAEGTADDGPSPPA
jgi:hypothetical protein